ncbi:GNAT family N-acetyltransferase [Kurthia gibsonii]|uniref:GNAT family N-acetyltransferase n=1 Tax=Kurthia gibsonii TaxID=33946 RepID=UPI0011447AFC|nr:GNAT family N-acetyltransferase [Kurthia gibsonii]MEB7770909.1 GNAT family N-acetyltransferase [Kurthia gibsonii]GED19426.1 IAA acetyltransferase [Kurthia gibsonii]
MQLFEVPVGAREKFLNLLILADEDETVVREYMNEGRLFEITEKMERVGVIQTIECDGYSEVKNIAITPERQGQGIGKKALRFVEKILYDDGAQIMKVGTANSSISNIAFYQKAGYRLDSIQHDFFSNYKEPIFENGIQAIDLLYFSKEL